MEKINNRKYILIITPVLFFIIIAIFLINSHSKQKTKELELNSVTNVTGNCLDYADKYIEGTWQYKAASEDYNGFLKIDSNRFTLEYIKLDNSDSRLYKGQADFEKGVLKLKFDELDSGLIKVFQEDMTELFNNVVKNDLESKTLWLNISYAPLSNPDDSNCYADSYFFTIFNLNFYRNESKSE